MLIKDLCLFVIILFLNNLDCIFSTSFVIAAAVVVTRRGYAPPLNLTEPKMFSFWPVLFHNSGSVYVSCYCWGYKRVLLSHYCIYYLVD